MIKNKLLFSFLAAALAAAGLNTAAAAEKKAALPELPSLTAADMPYDAGDMVLLRWPAVPGAAEGDLYTVYASSAETGGWLKAEEFPAAAKAGTEIDLPFWAWDGHKDEKAVKLELNGLFGAYPPGSAFNFKVALSSGGKVKAESAAVKAVPAANWFRLDRLNNLVLLIVLIAVFFWTVSHAKRKGLFIRRIAGLDAIDEAIGRATEMGRPIYYSTGIGSMSSVPTIASTSILAEVAKKVASYDTQLKVPHFDPIVMTVSKEIVKQAYTEAERPDSYRDDINFFVSQDQFSFAAAVDGMIHREKPAACFFIGHFMAESLLLAEVGATTGAIQIAGTEQESQLPFFFTSCDYTLIGEELYAAGAYLSKEPMLLSTLKVQDYGKAFVMAAVAGGSLLMLGGALFKMDHLVKIIAQLLKAY